MARDRYVRGGRCALVSGTLVAVVFTLWSASAASAFPYFARKYDVSCRTCHTTVPKLNAQGYAFRQRGYRFPGVAARDTIPFAGGFAGRYENRASDGVDDFYLAIVKAVTAGSIGERASYVVKWRPVSKSLDRWGNTVDRGGVFEDLFMNFDVNENFRVTAGQFRVFSQFDTALQLSASPPVALARPLPGEPSDDDRIEDLRAYSAVARTPAFMLGYRRPSSGAGASGADGWYANASIPFSGEFSIPVNERAQKRASFELESRPEGLVLESYLRRGPSSFGGAAFLDTGRQMYTGLAQFERARWGTSAAFSLAVLEGDSSLAVSWWGEYRPTFNTNLGLRLDDPGAGSLGAVLYGDYQWFSERAMVWLLLEQHLRSDAVRTLFQAKMVF